MDAATERRTIYRPCIMMVALGARTKARRGPGSLVAAVFSRMIDPFVSPSGPRPRRLRAVMVAAFAAAALTVAGAASAQTAGGGQIIAPDVASRLLEAVFNDDLEAVKISIADGADYEARGRLGRTALELAIDLGHFQIAHYFLALRQHQRRRVTRAQPPRPAPPPPFVPLQTPPEPPPSLRPPVPAVTAAAPVPPAPRPAPPAPMPAAPVEAVVATPVPPPPPAPKQAEPPAPAVAAVAPPPAAKASQPSAPASEQSEAAERVATAASTPPPKPPLPAVGLGLSLNLGKVPDAESGPGVGCVVKREGVLRICVEEVDWPEAVAEHFVIDAFLYRGTKALVRYEGGIAVRLYAQFPAASFDAVADYHARRLGPPSETAERESAQRGGGKLSNRTMIWRLGAPEGGTGAVVEIRQYDDVRRNNADIRYGVVQVAYEGTSAFFSRVSSLDLMRLR